MVVPCFDDGATLREALGDLTGQEPVELVVVDDGSRDVATLAVLDELRAEGIRVLRQENQGLAAARMAGVAATSAPYVYPLDADDGVVPGALTRLADVMDDAPHCAVSWGDQQLFGDLDLVSPRAAALDPWAITHLNGLPVSSLVRRTALIEAGGWVIQGGYEDWDLWMGLAERGWTGRRVGGASHRYRLHGTRMLATTRLRHGEQFAVLRARHPELFARRAAAWRTSTAPWSWRVLVPVVAHLPGLGAGTRHRLVLLVSWPRHAVRVRRARRRAAQRRPAPARAPAAPTSGS
ncbi:MAG: polysaccharide deacetylase family protein [Solirubrobacterales bacterium]|nr:polysaccharide deacetylase family protein [Solirubrobacterales bacterium]